MIAKLNWALGALCNKNKVIIKVMRSITSFQQANQVLYEFISPAGTPRKYTLDHMIQLMSILGNPQDKFKIVHVAGTSGKTSTSYYIASLLSAAGYKTGLTVSPHIDEVNERAQIDLMPLPEAEFCNELSMFMEIIDTNKLRPSYFELLIAFSLWLFHKRKVEYAVVEVGIGGLLDSTNIINKPDKVCVITDIGLDHIEILGDTIDQIAMQKAGIIKEKNAVFMNAQSPNIMTVIDNQCISVDAQLHVVNNTNPIPSLPLFQQRNFGLAQAAVNFILARDGHIELSDQKTKTVSKQIIPGRMEEVMFKDKQLILDGSHNEQKIEALVKSMKNRFHDKKIKLLVSFGETKRSGVQASMELLSQLAENVIVTDYSYADDSVKRAIKAQELGFIARQAGFQSITVEPNPQLAFNLFMNSPSEIGLVTGSFFLLNPVRDIVFEK